MTPAFNMESGSFLTTSLWGKIVGCGGWDESGFHKYIYLNSWSPVGRAVWKRLGGVALVEYAMSLGTGFEVSKAFTIPSLLPPPSLPPTCG